MVGFSATGRIPETREKIIDLSRRVEEVLLLLLSENEEIRQTLANEISDRERENKDLRHQLEKETGDLR